MQRSLSFKILLRISMITLFYQLKMYMRACRSAGISAFGNILTLFNVLTFFNNYS